MRKIVFESLLAAMCVLLVCCQKEPDQPVEPDKYLKLDFREKSISSSGENFQFSVDANCQWQITQTSDWVTVSPDEKTFQDSQTLSVKVSGNTETSERIAKLFFHYEGKKDSLTITQDGFEVYLNVSQSAVDFGYRTAETNVNVTSNCGWEAKAAEDWISIKPSTGLIGNFEMNITVKTNDTQQKRIGQIHLWNEHYNIDRYIDITQSGRPESEIKDYIDEYGINWGKGATLCGLTWAPVNLGYKENDFPFGKMYQWGRKYGLGYQDADFKDVIETAIAENWTGENGMEDPGTFYKYADGSRFNYDWIKEGDDSYWNCGTEENPVKNKSYDSCPEGWRIPTAFEFKSLIEYSNYEWTTQDSQSGYIFSDKTDESASDSLFIPAGGRLNTSDGLAYDRNIEGYYWTISADEGSSGYLFFYSEACSINYKGSRAGGCLVRCIRE